MKGNLGAALAGGVIGAALTGGALVWAMTGDIGAQWVRRAVVANPDMLQEAAHAMQARQYEPVLRAQAARLATPFASSWKGAQQPDVTLTYFFDYACGYCRQSNPALDQLVAEDKGLRIVYRELPILGQASFDAARASLAASKAGKFNAYHDRLSGLGQPTPANVALAAAAVGVPAAPPTDPDIDRELKANYDLAGQLGATGTPLFIVGNEVINSAVGYEGLKDAVARARAAKQAG